MVFNDMALCLKEARRRVADSCWMFSGRCQIDCAAKWLALIPWRFFEGSFRLEVKSSSTHASCLSCFLLGAAVQHKPCANAICGSHVILVACTSVPMCTR